jgi:hypothetical protein
VGIVEGVQVSAAARAWGTRKVQINSDKQANNGRNIENPLTEVYQRGYLKYTA